MLRCLPRQAKRGTVTANAALWTKKQQNSNSPIHIKVVCNEINNNNTINYSDGDTNDNNSNSIIH